MNFRVLPNRGPTSTQLLSASTGFLAVPSTLLEPKYHMWLGNFRKYRWKNSRLFFFPENQHTWYLEGADSKSALRFLKFWPPNPFFANLGQKRESCPFCKKFGTHSILRMIILIQTLVFWISNTKSIFGQKCQSCLFCLKMDIQSMVKMLILIVTLIFPISNLNQFLGKFGPEKSK